MNKECSSSTTHNDDMLPEYDFSGGVRGKHARALQQGYKVRILKEDGSVEERDYLMPEGTIVLDPDVRAYFPDAQAVNKALRTLISLVPKRPNKSQA
ncbi:MAG: hypothetical protein V1736_01945 [Pseudomonadota bacterium]